MRLLILNLRQTTGYSVRRRNWLGKDYYVTDVTMIVPGVLAGSKGPLLYPVEEIGNNVDAWNGMPLVVYHPTKGGQNVSARDPDVLEKQGVGNVWHTSFLTTQAPPGKDRPSQQLVAEAWFEVDALKRVDNRVLAALEQGRPIEISTGLYTDNEPAVGVWNGKPYEFIARNYRPDHLAILPDQVGACSLKDGCGIGTSAVTTNTGNPAASREFVSAVLERMKHYTLLGLRRGTL